MKPLGVCLVTRSSRDVIVECLTSLFEQTQTLDMDVVVVDNASQDDTVAAIRLNFPAVKLILNPENFGFSRAVNQGLRMLDARYYVLLNPDAVILENALERLVHFMEQTPQAGICVPKVLNSDGTLQYQCRRGEARPGEVFSYFLGLDRLFPTDPRFNGYLLRHLDNDVVNEVKAVSGSCMMIRRAVIEQVGYLDEHYFAYQEDTDYCLQARKSGWQVYYVPLGRVMHLGGRGGSDVSPYFGVYQWHRSYYLYYRKNLAQDYPFWFHPLYYLVMAGKFLLNFVVIFFSRKKIVGTHKPS
ncbi:MAG: glycosyltransferase family 2 protein [Anaerolineales bacterium]|nr:glycosyltransferase family 2 protein [Anaerolineales bacterium]